MTDFLTLRAADSRTYCLVELRRHTRAHGAESAVSVWLGCCQECGQPSPSRRAIA